MTVRHCGVYADCYYPTCGRSTCVYIAETAPPEGVCHEHAMADVRRSLRPDHPANFADLERDDALALVFDADEYLCAVGAYDAAVAQTCVRRRCERITHWTFEPGPLCATHATLLAKREWNRVRRDRRAQVRTERAAELELKRATARGHLERPAKRRAVARIEHMRQWHDI